MLPESDSKGGSAQTRHANLAAWTCRLLLVASIVWIGCLIADRMSAYAGDSDASGYMNAARLIWRGDFHPRQRTVWGTSADTLPFKTYVPLGFSPWEGDRLTPTYPIGLPVQIALAAKALGWTHAPGFTIGAQAILCLILVYLLCAELGLGADWSLLGAVILGSGALFVSLSLQVMSDVPATLWSAVSVLGVLKSRRARGWAALAGYAFMVGVTIRLSNAVMIVPLLVLLEPDVKRFMAFGVGILPPLLGLFGFNLLMYGDLMATGYPSMSAFFGPANVLPSLVSMARWLPVELTPLALLALAFPFVSRSWLSTRVRLGLMAWLGVYLAFYSVYQFTSENWTYQRFLMPAYPAIIAMALLVARESCTRLRLTNPRVVAPVACLVLGWNAYWWHDLRALKSGSYNRNYSEACAFVKEHLPGGSVILCMQASGAFLYYNTNPIVRWDSVDARTFSTIKQRCRATNCPVYLVAFPFELGDVAKRFPDIRWRKVTTVQDVTVWSEAGGA